MNAITKYCLKNVGCLLLMTGCSEFLDERTDRSLLIPESLQDLQAMLDNSNEINSGMYPGLLEVGTDDYLVPASTYGPLTQFEKDSYIWLDEPLYLRTNVNQHWKNPFIPVLIANTVLDELKMLDVGDKVGADAVRGQALFIRAFSYFHLAQVYCAAYRYGSDNSGLGLPLRLTADYNQPSVRATLAQTYSQIIDDFRLAADMLPTIAQYSTRGSRGAAYAALARVYLSMQDYDNALLYSNLSLEIHDALIDFADVSASAPNPFLAMNEETIFFAYSNGQRILNPNTADVHPELMNMYDLHDLRRYVYFQSKGVDRYGFKGSYIGLAGNFFFMGLTTPELYLIKAECLARQKKIQEALDVLNRLMEKRYDEVYFTPHATDDWEKCLRVVLDERRKELVFRGVRWSDLKRFNLDPSSAKVLLRYSYQDGNIVVHELHPNDSRYVYLIPQEVIEISGMIQNPR